MRRIGGRRSEMGKSRPLEKGCEKCPKQGKNKKAAQNVGHTVVGVEEESESKWFRWMSRWWWREKKVKKERSQVRRKMWTKSGSRVVERWNRNVHVIRSTLADISAHIYRSSVRGEASNYLTVLIRMSTGSNGRLLAALRTAAHSQAEEPFRGYLT